MMFGGALTLRGRVFLHADEFLSLLSDPANKESTDTETSPLSTPSLTPTLPADSTQPPSHAWRRVPNWSAADLRLSVLVK